MSNEQLWQAVLGEIELSLSKANFSTWFRNTFIASFDNERVVVGVPSGFVKSWLENKFKKDITITIESILNQKVKEIHFQIEALKHTNNKPTTNISAASQPTPAKNTATHPASQSAASGSHGKNRFGLNPRYTFQNFVRGTGNDLAYAACQAVVTNPGKAYNPLFVYGGVGLGKTHLIQALGHELVKRSLSLMYATSEAFINDYIGVVKGGAAREFKQRYRDVDVLIVDDIQFMAGHDGTQQEFFHVFNDLHQADKQIIIASDRPPKAIPGLEKRLLSRFEWGMIADVVPPDIDTRVAILKTKCKERSWDLHEDVIGFLASNIQNNVRELEGALNRLIAYHEFNNTTPTIESTKTVLNALIANLQAKSKTPKTIIEIVSRYYGINNKDIIGKCRKKELVTPRQIIMFLMREECGASFPAIGEELGGRDHTTAMHACNKIGSNIENDIKLKKDIDSIKNMLQEYCLSA